MAGHGSPLGHAPRSPHRSVALGAGAGLREPPAELASALPQDSAITAVIATLYSLLFSVLVAPPAMTVRGAYQNARLRSNLRRMADDLDRQIEAVYQRQRQE